MTKEDDAFLAQYDKDIEYARQQGAAQGSMPFSAAMFQKNSKQNLVEWELDFSQELTDIERLLRCDVLFRDKNGREGWIENTDKEAVVFNQRGVNDILREIILLVNKNKVLSYYGKEEISPRVRMVGHEIRSFIYNNYEYFGIDNEYKMNNYPMIVLAILDVIEAAYRRALNGETHKGLNEARVVNQSEPLMPQNFNIYPQLQGGKKKHWFNPMTWAR